jgi:Zn-dependent peptidase ImmA (M78 family)/transcriptional regulator with XRE-family HTH domain
MQRSILEQLDPRTLGTRLQDARKVAGLTQQLVADRMEMARTTIVAIEKGERRVTVDELLSFARMYSRQVSEFVSRRALTESFVPQFRATERDVLEEHADYEQATVDLQKLAEDYAELERLAGVPAARPYPPPYEVAGTPVEQTAAYVASSERNRLGLGDGPLGNLRERLESDLGLRIFYYPMPSRIAGVFAYNDSLGACIGINLSHPKDRRQWSLAHEFGHFLMHRYRAEITVLEVRRRSALSERLADEFAAQFLLPASGLERRVLEVAMNRPTGVTLADIISLSDLYQVSVQAMILRLESLRRLPAGTWDRLKAEAFRRSELSEGELARYLRTDRVTARAQVKEAQQQIYSEQDEFANLADLDLGRPLDPR